MLFTISSRFSQFLPGLLKMIQNEYDFRNQHKKLSQNPFVYVVKLDPLYNFCFFWHSLDFFCKRQKFSEKNGASCDLKNWRPNVTQLVLQILWKTSTENFILERYIFWGTKLEKTPYLLNGWSICFEPLRTFLGLVPTWPYILSPRVSREHILFKFKKSEMAKIPNGLLSVGVGYTLVRA